MPAASLYCTGSGGDTNISYYFVTVGNVKNMEVMTCLFPSLSMSFPSWQLMVTYCMYVPQFFKQLEVRLPLGQPALAISSQWGKQFISAQHRLLSCKGSIHNCHYVLFGSRRTTGRRRRLREGVPLTAIWTPQWCEKSSTTISRGVDAVWQLRAGEYSSSSHALYASM